jgi:hypothetical protein
VTHTGRYHGGLVFAGTQENALDKFSRIVSATLKDYGHYVERQSVMNPQRARITANQYLVKLNLGAGTVPDRHIDDCGDADVTAVLNESEDPLQRLEIVLCPVDPACADQTHSELLLVVMMYRMVDAYSVEYVEWLDPEMALTTEEFLGAFSSVSPRRVRGRQQILDDLYPNGDRFAPIEETAPGLDRQYEAISGQKPFGAYEGPVSLTEQEALALAFRTEPHPDEISAEELDYEPDNNVRRLASWGMTGMLFFVSAPVAASMAAVNLIKGEDFRLNTQVLSLSGCLVLLESSGALAEVVSYLPL